MIKFFGLIIAICAMAVQAGALEVVVTGNKNVTQQEIASFYEQALKEESSISLESNFCSKIESLYSERGYLLAMVDSVSIKKDKVLVNILEGSLGEVVILTVDERITRLMQPYVDQLKSLKPFNILKAEPIIASIENIPGIYGVEFQPLFAAPDKSDPLNPKTGNLVITPKIYAKVLGSIKYGSRSSYFKLDQITERDRYVRYNAAGSDAYAIVNNMLKNYDQFFISGSTDGTKSKYSLHSFYKLPIGLYGKNLTFDARKAHNNHLADFDAHAIGVKYTMPMILERTRELDVFAKVSHYDERESYRRFANYNKILLGTSYERNLDNGSYWIVGVEHHRNLGRARAAGRASKDAPLIPYITGGKFSKNLFSFDFAYNLPKNFALSGFVDWQLSNDILPTAECISSDNTSGGRGFRNSEIYGDKGVAASLELSYAGYFNHGYFRKHKEYIYVDGTSVRNNGDIKERHKQASLASIGAGTRITVIDNVSVLFEISKPIALTGSAENRRASKEAKLFYGIEYNFNF